MNNKESLRPYTCCFSGHRKISEDKYQSIRESLRKTITALIDQGYKYFGAGGALGFDTIAAETVLELKAQYPHIKLIMVLPCRNQHARWHPRDVQRYEKILSKSDKIVYVSQTYTSACMMMRNRRLVDASSTCVCYLSESVGGTAYTITYAKENGLNVINLAND